MGDDFFGPICGVPERARGVGEGIPYLILVLDYDVDKSNHDQHERDEDRFEPRPEEEGERHADFAETEHQIWRSNICGAQLMKGVGEYKGVHPFIKVSSHAPCSRRKSIDQYIKGPPSNPEPPHHTPGWNLVELVRVLETMGAEQVIQSSASGTSDFTGYPMSFRCVKDSLAKLIINSVCT